MSRFFFFMATKKSVEEKLDSKNIEHVIALLEPTDPNTKPITKKDACAILAIAYNTTRLAKIINEFKEKKLATAARRQALRGKPATPGEVQFIVSSYLEGQSIEALADKTYRSSIFVRGILDQYSVPIRARAHDYNRPQLIPEDAVKSRFTVGELVYSSRYDSLAIIKGELFQKNQWVYRIWLKSDKWQQFAYQEAAELASLQHLKDKGILI